MLSCQISHLHRLLSCWNWENFSCLQVDELQLSCLFLNPGFQPATSTYLSRCVCHLPLVNLRPTSYQHKKSLFNPGFFYRTLEPFPASYCRWRCTLFSPYQAPTGREGFVASLIFPNTRFFLGRCNSSQRSCYVPLKPGFYSTGCEDLVASKIWIL